MLVQCRQCAKKIKVTEKMYGRKVKCRCGTVMRMPSPQGASTSSTNSSVANAAASSLAPAPSEIQFQCPKCQQRLAVPSTAAGQVTQCTCGVKMRVPQPATQALAPDPFALPAENQELDDLEPLDDFGLEPLDGAPITLAPPTALPSSVPPGQGNPYGTPSGTPAYLQSSSPKSGKRKVVRKKKKRESNEGYSGISVNGQIIGGFVLMGLSVVLFLAILSTGWIHTFPIWLFVVGLITLVKGIAMPG